MALSVIQVGDCYVSSSCPKALYVPSVESYYQNKKSNLSRKTPSELRFKKEKIERSKSQSTAHSKTDEEYKSSAYHSLPVQTDLYLEEICDVPLGVDVECETEPFIEEELQNETIPVKTGQDVETQVYPDELFDFDEEVQPVLDELVEHTLKLSVLEVMEEEDLEALEEIRLSYEARKRSKLDEIEALDKQEKDYLEEKERRLREKEEAIELEDEIAQKIAACTFSKHFLSNLIPNAYKKLEAQGYLENKNLDKKELEDPSSFWPWLINEVDHEIATLETSCHLLDSIIKDTDSTTKNSDFADENLEDFGTEVKQSDLDEEQQDITKQDQEI